MKATVDLGKTLECQPTRSAWLAVPLRYLEKAWSIPLYSFHGAHMERTLVV